MRQSKFAAMPSEILTRDRNWLLLAYELLIALAFFVAVLFLRLPSFGRSVVDWDETVYLLIAREWFRGALPYTTLWDHKPPGIYVIFLLGQWVFGQTVLSIRILTCIAVTLSCYLIYRFGRDILRSGGAGIFAAVFYMAYSLKNVGETAHAELFFNPFVILGFYLILRLARREQATAWYSALIGLVFGLAMQIKFSVLFDFMAAIVVYMLVVVFWRKWFSLYKVLAHGLFMGLGFMIPFLAFVALYAASGQLDVFMQANFTANAIYYDLVPFSIRALANSVLLQIEEHDVLWLALLLAPGFLVILARSQKVLDYHVLALLIWLAGSFVAVSITKRFYPYYFLQMLPALCLLTAYLIFSIYHTAKGRDSLWAHFLLVFMILQALFEPLYMPIRTSVAVVRHQQYNELDDPALVAAYLRERVDRDTILFVVDYQPVLYYMVDAVIPTRYIVPMVLTHDHWARVAEIDRYQEVELIMERKPHYVVLKDHQVNDKFYKQLHAQLARDYEKEIHIGGAVIYRRSSSSSSTPKFSIEEDYVVFAANRFFK